MEECKFGDDVWEDAPCDYAPRHQGHVRRKCSGYGALRKMVAGVKPTGVAAVGAAPGAGRYQSGGAGNAENTPGTGTGIQRREGDWDCAACGFAGNFAFRETCFRCRAAKGSSGGGAHAGLGSNANVDAGSTTKDAEGDKEAKERRRSQIAAVTQQLEALAAEVKKTGEGFNAQLAAEAMHVAAAMPTSFEPLEVAEEMEPEGKTSATKRAKPTNEGMGKSVRLTGCQVPGRGVLELRWTAESEESAEAPMSKEELQELQRAVGRAMKAMQGSPEYGVQRFGCDQVAIGIGSAVVHARAAIYDTGCDTLVITSELLDRFDARVRNWIRKHWRPFIMNGVGGEDKHAFVVSRRMGASAVLAPGSVNETVVESMLVVLEGGPEAAPKTPPRWVSGTISTKWEACRP
ncbi:hypothetical protein RI054_02g10200 [Pseudoscourfieldia marina]